MGQFYAALSFLVCAFAIHSAHSANYQLVVSDWTLPQEADGLSAVYDGQDDIYLVGGKTGRVWRFSVTSGVVTDVAPFPIVNRGGSLPALATDGDIWYFGGENSTSTGAFEDSASWAIYKYSTSAGSYSQVGALPKPMQDQSVAFDEATQTVYLFGGWSSGQLSDTVQGFKLSAGAGASSPAEVGRLIAATSNIKAAWVPNDGAYVFGDNGDPNDMMVFGQTIQKYNSGDTSSTKLSVKLPASVRQCAVLAGGGKVLIPGYQTLMQFDPATQVAESLAVDNYTAHPIGSGCAYVPKLDRVYFFGGSKWEMMSQTLSSAIAYIDLGTTGEPTTTTEAPSSTTATGSTSTDGPTTTGFPSSTSTTTTAPAPAPAKPSDCSDGTTRLIPDPTCCESYISCKKGKAKKAKCPVGQQFSAVSSNCENAATVNCRVWQNV